MSGRIAGVIAGLMGFVLAGVSQAQIVMFNSFGAGDTFSTTSPLVVGRATTQTNVFAARFTTVSNGTINSVQVALGPTAPAGESVTLVARLFGHSVATGLPTSANDTMTPRTVHFGAAQIVTFESTAFLQTFSGTTMWLVISIEEPVIAGRTVAWNKSPSATGNLALSVNGAAFTSQGANVSMPAFKVIGEGLNGACCNTATSQCILTGHLECTQWNGFVYTPGSPCSVNTCAATGACCTGMACAVTSQAACGVGRFLGVATACQSANGTNACCAADFNGVGGLGVQDVFDFLAAWFAGCP